MSVKPPNQDLSPAKAPPFPLRRVMTALLLIAAVFAASALMLPKMASAKDAIALDPAQTQQVMRVQDYLNSISTLRAQFLQVTSQGQYAQGRFMMARPGRMRIDYDPPTPILIVSDGTWIMYKDKELDQVSFVPLSSTPASIFIGDSVNFFGEDLRITNYSHKAGVIRITVQRTKDPMSGTLTLVFAAQPLMLKKWVVVDSQEISTTVSLMGAEFGVALKDSLFKVENRPLVRHPD